MFAPHTPDSLIQKVKAKHPELSDESARDLAERYFELGKVLVGMWRKEIEKQPRDPPKQP